MAKKVMLEAQMQELWANNADTKTSAPGSWLTGWSQAFEALGLHEDELEFFSSLRRKSSYRCSTSGCGHLLYLHVDVGGQHMCVVCQSRR